MRTYTHQGQHHTARGTREREGHWGAMLFIALVLVSAAGGRVFGATPRPPVDRVCSLTQVTHTARSSTFSPAFNAAGTHIAFPSSADLTGDNPDGNFEIFLFRTFTDTFTQVTNTTEHLSQLPSINAAGTRIAFRSDANLTGDNPDGNEEIFLFHTLTDTFTQVTHTMGFPSVGEAVISGLGTRIALSSTANLTGDNPDGNEEIFLFHTLTDTFTQVTHTTGIFRQDPPFLSINTLGTHIAFASNADLTGDNPDGNVEIFLFHTPTSTVTQVTHTGPPDGNFSPALNAAGTLIAFHSSADLTGDNPDGSGEIFLFHTLTDTFTQVTNATESFSQFPSINAAGTRIAFSATANLTGDNPDGNEEIFLATCRAPGKEGEERSNLLPE